MEVSPNAVKNISFGKYRGKTFAEVYAEDEEYCKWVLRKGTDAKHANWDAFYKYIVLMDLHNESNKNV
jgi:hypothetical protein